jgi:hypothetical protein
MRTIANISLLIAALLISYDVINNVTAWTDKHVVTIAEALSHVR